MSDIREFWEAYNQDQVNKQHHGIGIPIPKMEQNIQSFTRPMNSFIHEQQDNNFGLGRPPLVPPNSLVSNINQENNSYHIPFDLNMDSFKAEFSPLDGNSPMNPPPMHDIDDMEIKMEPMDDILTIGSEMIHQPSYQEENLLDNVIFDELLMTTNEMDASTPCLDPQHSSPAAMAPVRPDDILGMTRHESKNLQHQNNAFSSSINVPGRNDMFSGGANFGLASSLPPLLSLDEWRDNNGFGMSVPNQLSFGNQQHQPFTKEFPSMQNRISVTGFSLSQEDKSEPSSNSNEPFFLSSDFSHSNTSPTLHDLLIDSPQSNVDTPPKIMSPENQSNPLQVDSPDEYTIGQSVPSGSGLSFLQSNSSFSNSRLSSSAPANDFSLEQFWQRREPRKHLLSTSSMAEETGGSASSLSTGLSPIPHDLSIDEEIDSEDDSDNDHYDSDSDDNESLVSEDISGMSSGHSGKKERHFWQYNVQAKGPKGQRVNIMQNNPNSPMLNKIMDPVFSPLCSVQGIKHSGKARRGDGNDLTPNPKKLVAIGNELEKLNKKINDMTPVTELPSTVRTKSRKEKNKLASRACRLKKKAQHEANKIKLYGIQQENELLAVVMGKIRENLAKKVELLSKTSSADENLMDQQHLITTHIERTATNLKDRRISGLTTEFINKVIENCRGGNPSGGLDDLERCLEEARISSPDSQLDSCEMFS